MSNVNGLSRIQELRRALSQADPAAFLVEPRVIRRVIRERFSFAQLSASIPHIESQIVPDDDVRHLVHPDELGLSTFDELPKTCILICEPDEGELNHWPVQELLQKVWRRLFHAQIDRELSQRLHSTLRRSDIQQRIAQIGQVEFDEAHFVLRSELRLVDPESRIEAWREFVALFLELKWFEPDLLQIWFPSIAGNPDILQTLATDVNAEEVFQRTRLYGATTPDLTPHVVRDEASLANTRRDWSMGIGIVPSDRAYVRQLRRRDRANERGNTVAAAVFGVSAVQQATSEDKRTAAREKAKADIRYLVDRLRRAIDFSDDDTEAWQASLWELATNSVHGFWNSEKRLLYDLQKVCLDHERVTYKVDLVKWVVSRGRRPLRRPLNGLREVMMAKHLASSRARLVDVRLSGIERERLTGLLHKAVHLAEEQMRHRMRPVLQQTLRDVQLLPGSVPEQVACDKLTEDSLDCIADRGYLTMGYLRDAISKNDLKLPDLKEAHELWRGDHLLRADDRLDVAMDGVYRRGEFYLRWLQITSSVFFGTPSGRFATQFLVIPFGGALVIVEGVKHTFHTLQNLQHRGTNKSVASGSPEQKSVSKPTVPDAANNAATAISGTDNDSISVAGSETSDPTATQQSIDADSSVGNSGKSVGSVDEIAANDASVSDAVTIDDSNAKSGDAPSVAQLTESKSKGATEEKTSAASSSKTLEIVQVVPQNTDEAFGQIVKRQVETLSWVLVVGFLLMGLIHVAEFRRRFFVLVSEVWRITKRILIDTPLQLLRLPFIQKIWRSRTVVKFRRYVLTPAAVSIVGAKLLPALLTGRSPSWWWVGLIGANFSLALNSRLGQDAQELSAEWVGNTWYKLRARVVMAFIDWIIDVFRVLLNFVERFLYAVDEWLRFHSDESWLSIVAKAVLGVIWSFVSFLIRIYVNLLIEPTLHPVKHFPVVTVAHKMFLPAIKLVGLYMVDLFKPYLGVWMAGLLTGFNIFFLPGIFGFLVWELKENWRLYRANRKQQLTPVPVGSHGETVARLLRPGFHSGTLPKLFRRMRRLEHQSASFKRFSARRAAGDQLEHAETAIRNFVNRELIRLLQLCPAWSKYEIQCGHIHAASNSFWVDLQCDPLGIEPVRLLFQEQSGWVAASVARIGWLSTVSSEQLRSFQNALEGFYRKSGVDLVREQLEANFTHKHPYDINSEGLAIWPNGKFDQELSVDLYSKGIVRPVPSGEASAAGICSANRDAVLFSESNTEWQRWQHIWTCANSDTSELSLPQACVQPPPHPVTPPIQ